MFRRKPRPVPLRLKAESAEDAPALSAALQDALAQIAGFAYDKRARTFTLEVNRFRWETGPRARPERVRAALQISGVLSVRSKRLRQGAPDAVVSLLALAFAPGAEPPGGVLTLTFAGGGALAIEVEALEAVLVDVSEPWRAKRRPRHPKAEAFGDGR